MTCSGRIILVRLVLVTVIISSLIGPSEGSRYHSEDGSKSPRHRHRHRHDVTSVALSRRSHEIDSSRRSQWPQQEDEYEDALNAEEDDDEEDEDYETERSRALYERNYQPSRNPQRSYHSRFEPRYPLRHHQGGHHGNPWYRGGGGGGGGGGVGDEEDADRRRNSRYGGPAGSRGHKFRPGRDRIYHEDRRRSENPSAGYLPRNDEFDVPEDDIEEEEEADRDSGYERTSRRWRLDEDIDENSQDHHGTGSGSALRRRNSRRYRPFEHHGMSLEPKGHRARQDPRRNEWKSRGSISTASAVGSSVSSVQRNEDDDWTERRRKTGTIVRGGKRLNRLPIDEPDNDHREEDRNENKESWSNKRSKNNLIDRVFNAGEDRKKDNDLDDLDYDDDVVDDGEIRKVDSREEEEEKEEEEENIWKEADDNEDLDDEEDAFDNTNYYKKEDEPPYKTFDDIIKSLTSNDPTTPKPTVRRDYRNTGIEKYLRKDAYGNIYDSRNITIGARDLHDPYNSLSPRYQNWNVASNKWRSSPRKPDIGTYSNVRESKKFSNSIGDPGSWKGNRDVEKKKVHAKLNEPSAKTKTKTKSLEQDYDEDYEDNEKDEDIVKVRGIDNVTEMQADITNAEYVDEENETETDDETSAPLVTSPPTTTTSTTTTTTPRPVVTIIPPSRDTHDRRDSRFYETSSAPQSNGLQQPAHGAHNWQSLNTHDGTKDSKGHGQQNNRNGKSEIKEALQHAIKVSREGSCQWPRARVVPVRDVYPSPSTTYIPHCAILHRCSDDTGCCRSEALTCVPKVSHRVELYFYTTSVGGASVVEKLSFYNHTECECKERSEYGASSDKMTVTNEHRFTRHHPPATSPPQNIRRPPQKKSCKCPSEFTPRITPEGECQCNCFENDQNCIRTRRGKGYFSLRDRLCIQNEECATPVCEFGEYMRRQGKCPRKKDKFDDIARYPTNLHHRFRS